MEEKRSCPRISINTHCFVYFKTSSGVLKIDGVVRDFSIGGMCLLIADTPGNEKLMDDSEEVRVVFNGPASVAMDKREFAFSFCKRWSRIEDGSIRIGGTHHLLSVPYKTRD